MNIFNSHCKKKKKLKVPQGYEQRDPRGQALRFCKAPGDGCDCYRHFK